MRSSHGRAAKARIRIVGRVITRARVRARSGDIRLYPVTLVDCPPARGC